MKMVSIQDQLNQLLKDYELGDFFPASYHKQLQITHYQKGQSICQQGDQLTALYFFLKGKTKVVRRLFNGKEHILEIQKKPCLIGDIELMTNSPAVSSVISMEDSLVIQLPLRDKAELLADPAFLYQLGRNLAQKLYTQNITSTTNLSYSVKERLATHILEYEEEGLVKLELTPLADSFGTSYRHLGRCLKDLIELGLLQKTSFKHYQILDYEGLNTLLIQN